ncbi:unnamed protein product [Nippostrongylus brasiliensis]|uniref:ShKT domain-containing protein n=1 Tax=Nippostrongylus brasiliensis TaxID=27835 RepID=A0A158QY18_NIPBR|nr:unnamed protein product [Nippostrongylus brasiliensis]
MPSEVKVLRTFAQRSSLRYANDNIVVKTVKALKAADAEIRPLSENAACHIRSLFWGVAPPDHDVTMKTESIFKPYMRDDKEGDASDDNPVTIRFQCQRGCCDHHEWCRFWASSNRDWMAGNCQLACGTCKRGKANSHHLSPFNRISFEDRITPGLIQVLNLAYLTRV